MKTTDSTTVLWQLLIFLLDEECATSLPECLKATRIIERQRPKFEALYRAHQEATAARQDAHACTDPGKSRRKAASTPLPAARAASPA
ncbi:MAG TPA: hypothetical protein ENK62_04070 [Chromatiales bacterium]|nr:hypothetical protein [Chromatiales bacterium]